MPRWTAGATRSLENAARIARAAGRDTVEPVDLLDALLSEESRACELLASFGLAAETPTDHVSPEAGTGESAAQTVESPRLREVLDEAVRQARLAGRDAEVGTEHLLPALCVVPSPAADRLRRQGITAEDLAARAATGNTGESEPIPVDEPIDWSRTSPAADDRAPACRAPVRPITDQSDTWRILDAAADRVREGLRVVEDFVRFSLDDRHLTRSLKECRHEIWQALERIDAHRRIACRDTIADVGTTLRTPTESQRGGLLDVARANFERVQEALRSLEEFGKTVDGALPATCERVRYLLYTIEKAVLTTARSRERLANRQLYLLLTESNCRRPYEEAVSEAVAGGVSILQVREKGVDDGELLDRLRIVRRLTADADVLLVVNDRPDLAVLADANGVHLGQEDLPVREARRIVGPDRLIGVSTHSIEQARQAVLDGADYLGVGPTFPSRTKSFERFAGLEFVKQIAGEVALPWFAIGGIDTGNLGEVLAAGATRVAVSATSCGADDPGSAARLLNERLRGGGTSG